MDADNLRHIRKPVINRVIRSNVRARTPPTSTEKKEKHKTASQKAPFVVGIVRHNVGSPYGCNIGAGVRKPRNKRHIGSGTKQCSKNKEAVGKTAFSRRVEGQAETPSAIKYDKSCETPCDNPTEVLQITPVTNAMDVACFASRTDNFETNDRFVAEENCDEETKSVVSSYRQELEKEIEVLKALCNEWTPFSEENSEVPAEMVGLVIVALGQTNLLINKKLTQYRDIINKCSNKRGPGEVTKDDLCSFRDIVYIQIYDVRSKFAKLEALRDNDWKELEKENRRPPAKKRCRTEEPDTTKSKMKSSVCDHIPDPGLGK